MQSPPPCLRQVVIQGVLHERMHEPESRLAGHLARNLIETGAEDEFLYRMNAWDDTRADVIDLMELFDHDSRTAGIAAGQHKELAALKALVAIEQGR